MIDQKIAGSRKAERETAADQEHAPDPLQMGERQPDPMLQMSTGRLRGGGLSLVALAIVVFIAVVLFGLDHRATGPTAPSTPVATSTGAPRG